MANEDHSPSEQSTTSLLQGIISDIGDLIRQEVRFARTEMKADLRKSKEAFSVLVLGAGIAAVGGILLALMLVFLLYWLSAPAGTDPAVLPLWGCFGIVAAIVLAAGAALLWTGVGLFEKFTPLPTETAQTVKENVEWIMSSK